MYRLYLLVLFAVFLATGCANDRNNNEMNDLWRAGYGFNNPNANRIRQGQKPLDFSSP